MSVRQAMLALLAEQPMYGYQLRQVFQERTGETWPLNIGQVYTTLNRLQRDGLVAEADRREDGSVVYRLTEQGRSEVTAWWSTPVPRVNPDRDELAIKVALACSTAGVDVAAVVQRQRVESLRSLQEYTRLTARVTSRDGGAAHPTDLTWLLVLDRMVFAAEAEVRWLDQVEQRVHRTRSAAPGPEGSPGPSTRPQTAARGSLPVTSTTSGGGSRR